MKNKTSDQSNQAKADQNKPNEKRRKSFPSFQKIIEAEAKSKNMTVEEVMKNMRSQYAGTIRPHEEVMREIIGPNWDKDFDEEVDLSASEESSKEEKKDQEI